MSIAGPRWWLLPCITLALAGCASAPSAHHDEGPPQASEHEGWLWKSVTGQKDAPSTKESAPASPSPQPPGTSEGAGPLVPGPSSASKWHRGAVQTSAESPIVPPPTIPAELPQPSSGVSLNDVKPEEPKKKGFDWSDLSPENAFKNLKTATGYGPDEKIARAAMKEGEALFRDKKYKEAAAKFATAASRWPDTPLEEDALFLQGESEFFADEYPKAHDTYGGLLKKYANTRHMDIVCAHEYAIGRYWEQLDVAHPVWPIVPNFTDGSKPFFDTFGYAIQAYERIRQNDPTGPLADTSLMALGNAYFCHGHFEEAAYNYDLLRKDYPSSKHQMNAHLFELQSKMRIYQGTAYDETPLRDAKKIAEQTLKQFGNKLDDERSRVEQSLSRIVEEMANRQFAQGQYYEQHAYYGAARLYYQTVVKDYPKTQIAREAQARLDKIRNEPDEPPHRFGWLTGAFESKTK
ncbi:MAG: outer membrane protein assembly factor BamD [Thermoguttaceae bacterium]